MTYQLSVNKLVKYWTPVFLWAGLIFYLSSVPDLKSGMEQDYLLRKLAHITEYFILVFLLHRAFIFHNLNNSQALAISFVVSLLYAVSDEIHQLFIEGRQGRVMDVFIDSGGIIIYAVYFFLKKAAGYT